MTCQYFADLKKIANDTTKHTHALCDIEPKIFKARGIDVLVLDFDGVMNAYGECLPKVEVITWLKEALTIYPSSKIIILTNKPFAKRQHFFDMHFPGIKMPIYPKKPYQNGLLDIAKQLNTSVQNVLIIDDRLLTGILAGLLAGTEVLWIKRPYISFKKRPVVELGFVMLRWMERVIF